MILTAYLLESHSGIEIFILLLFGYSTALSLLFHVGAETYGQNFIVFYFVVVYPFCFYFPDWLEGLLRLIRKYTSYKGPIIYYADSHSDTIDV